MNDVKKIKEIIGFLFKEAREIMEDTGIEREKEILSLVRAAETIAWNNLDDNELGYIEGVTATQYSIACELAEIHKQRLIAELDLN